MSNKEARDEDVMFPDVTLPVGGVAVKIAHVPLKREEVVVKELTFGQSMALEPLATRIINSIAAVIDDKGTEDEMDWSAIMAAIAQHPDEFKRLLSASTGRDVEWLDALSDRDGRAVVVTFMKVNWDFFIDRLLIRGSSRTSLKAAMSMEEGATV